MPVPTNDSDKKSAAQDLIYLDFNASGEINGCYYTVNSTSYSNKSTALDALDDLSDALAAARTAVNNLA